MNKLFLSMALLFTSISFAQQNTLLSRGFWKADTSVAQVETEISKGNNPAEKDSGAFDPTTIAIMQKAPLSTLVYMVELPGNGVHKTTHDGRTYLHWAAMAGNSELMAYLLEKGASLQVKDTRGNTPIAYAALSGQTNTAVYETFFKHGVNPLDTYQHGANLLLLCVAHDQASLPLTNYFVSKGMNLTSTDNYGRNLFDYACQKGNIELLNELSKQKINPTNQALLMAAQGLRRHNNKVEVYKYLVEKQKQKVKTTDHTGSTALHYLARKGDTDGVRFLLSQKAKINKVNNQGNTPILEACHTKNFEVIKLLFSQKEINLANNQGKTPLLVATQYSSPQVVSFLLEKGALTSLDSKGNGIVTALVESFTPARPERRINENTADIALKAQALTGKNINLAQSEAQANNAYHYAATKHSPALIKLVSTWGANINQKNTHGETPLIKAALVAQNNEVLKALVEQGANKNATTEFGETAFDLAKENEMLTTKNISVDFLK